MMPNYTYILWGILILSLIILVCTPISNNNESFNNTIFTSASPTELERIDELERKIAELDKEHMYLSNITKTMYEHDINGNFIANGWFVMIHNVMVVPTGLELAESIKKYYGIKNICFRVESGFPFLGNIDQPVYLPKSDDIGFRAMTILKIPKTGIYSFRVTCDDGARLYYQKVDSRVIYDEKNIRSTWTKLLDMWSAVPESSGRSIDLKFKQNDLIMLRFDWFEHIGFAAACIKMIIDKTDEGLGLVETDLPFENTYCSLLWSDTPLMGIN